MDETKVTATCDANEQAKVMLLQEITDLAMHVYDLREAVEHIYHYDGKPIVCLTEKAFKALFGSAEYTKREWSYDSYSQRWERTIRYELHGIVFRSYERRPAELTKPED